MSLKSLVAILLSILVTIGGFLALQVWAHSGELATHDQSIKHLRDDYDRIASKLDTILDRLPPKP